MKSYNMVSIWGNPGEKVTANVVRNGKRVKVVSGYGNVTYAEWCDKELARISAKTSDIQIVKNTQGKIALARL